MQVRASFADPACPGLVLLLSENEPAVSAGDGIVASVDRVATVWPSNQPIPIDDYPLWRVSVNHGEGVFSNVLGLGTVQVAPRQIIARGDVLGMPYNREILFQIVDNRRIVDPANANRHFDAYSEPRLLSLRGWIQQAPDRVKRVFASVESVILAGIRQFNHAPCDFLVNVAFNGNGTATGPAVLGSAGDFWNSVMPDYSSAPGYYCTLNGTWKVVSGQVAVPLRESTSDLSAVCLIKEGGFIVGGSSGATWHPMMNRWIGAAPTGQGATNTFSLRGLPAGLVTFHLYAQGQAGAQASLRVNGVQRLSQSLTANPGAFTLGSNYVVLAAMLAPGDVVVLRVIGKASGLQIRKLANPPPPDAPALIAPASGSTVIENQATSFSWNDVAGATGYDLQFDSDTPLDRGSATSFNLTTNELGAHTWRVRSRSAAGAGPYSTEWLFTVTLPAPILIAPADGATVIAGQATSFSWNDVAGATGYDLQFDSDTPLDPGSATSFAVSIGTSGAHTWRVRAKSATGAGPYSTARSFTANTAPTLTTVTTLPGATQDTAFTITFATLAAAANEADANGDTLSFRIEAVSSGTLTKGGSAVTPGTTLLATGESLVWTPSQSTSGTLPAFTIKAWDGVLASATPVQVQVTVAQSSLPVIENIPCSPIRQSCGIHRVLAKCLITNNRLLGPGDVFISTVLDALDTYYFEFTPVSGPTGNAFHIGVAGSLQTPDITSPWAAPGAGVVIRFDGVVFLNGDPAGFAFAPRMSLGVIHSITWNGPTSTFTVRQANTVIYSQAFPTITALTPLLHIWAFAAGHTTSEAFVNLGPDFLYAPPAGAVATCRDARPDIWWSMDETAPLANRVDATGNGHSLIPQGSGVAFSAGKVGNAVVTSGALSYLERNSPGIPSLDADFTFCGWAKSGGGGMNSAGPLTGPDASLVPNTSLIKVQSTGGDVFEVLIYGGNGDAMEAFPDHGWYVNKTNSFEQLHFATPVIVDQWYFWAVTYSRFGNMSGSPVPQVQLYRDGTLVAAKNFQSSLGNFATQRISIGELGLSLTSDEVCRFPAVLTLAEIQWLYNSGNGRAFADLP